MSYISSFHSSPHPKDSTTHDRSSPGLSKSNFKKFTLLHQHDNPSKKAENNLQKTLSLIHNRSPEAHKPIDYSYRRGSISKIEHMDSVYSPKRASESKVLIDRNRENISLRNDIEDLKYENYLLKVNHSPARLKRSYIEESKPENIVADNESLRHQVRELMKENEGLRYEVTHVKAEYQRRYEDVKKSNDSLLLSYEERHRQSLQSVKENYENEINDLKGEIGRLQTEINRNEEMFKHQKDKLLTSNMRLEKEKQDLFLKVNQISLANAIGTRSPGYANDSFTAKETSNQFMDQVLKEKHELLGQYNDLFSSYNIMLEHNRVLTEKLENVEKERDELLKLHDLPPSTARRHHEKKKKAQVYEESPGKSKRSKDSHRSLTVKTSKETSKKASVQPMNSSLNQRTRELLMEELKDDLNNFEDKLKASTGSLDGILNPKLASSGNKVPQLSKSGTLRNSGILKENAYGLINNSKGQQPRSSSAAKSSRSKDKKGNASALIENDKEQNVPQSSMRSSIKNMTQKNSNSSRGSPKVSKKLSLSTAQSRHSISELSTRNNSTKGGKVPLYSKVKKI